MGPAGRLKTYTDWTALPTLDSTMLLRLYERRSLVRAALTTIGSMPTAKITVAIAPASAGTPTSTEEGSPVGGGRRVGGIMQPAVKPDGRSYVRGTRSCSYAYAVAADRVETRSLPKMFATCRATVFSLRKRSPAI